VKWEKAENKLESPADGLICIGKEANNIEDQPLDVTGAQVFIDEKEIKQKILALTPEEARKMWS
jgi:galactitol-specific phosphotransferase system IIB component